MVPIAQRIARAGRGRLAVVRLLNSVRGWDTRHTPVEDVRWALDQLRSEYDGLPTCLVGHSLGGRAALLAGDQPEVSSVVALNPWVHPEDRVDLAGRPVLVVHGTEDRIADPGRSAAMTKALARTTMAGYLRVTGGQARDAAPPLGLRGCGDGLRAGDAAGRGRHRPGRRPASTAQAEVTV